MLISWLWIKRFKQTSCGGFWDGGISGAWVQLLLRSLSRLALVSVFSFFFLIYVSNGIWPPDRGSRWPEGRDRCYSTSAWDAASYVCELATILILFVQTDPVPFYFQLVENKLVLFLLSVAMTTQPLFFFFFWWIQRSQGNAQKGPFSFSRDFVKVFYHLYPRWRLFCVCFSIFLLICLCNRKNSDC